jgi:hypothetical protein
MSLLWFGVLPIAVGALLSRAIFYIVAKFIGWTPNSFSPMAASVLGGIVLPTMAYYVLGAIDISMVVTTGSFSSSAAVRVIVFSIIYIIIIFPIGIVLISMLAARGGRFSPDAILYTGSLVCLLGEVLWLFCIGSFLGDLE